MTPSSTTDIASLCSAHLHEEERLLAAALLSVRAIQLQLARRDPATLAELVEQHQGLAQMMRDMQQRRHSLCEVIASRLKIAPQEVRLSQVVPALPRDARSSSLPALLARVRRMADELALSNRRVALHLSVYLDVYQHLLRDLTGTDSGSGRYGPHGKADRLEYRPLIQMHG